MKFQKRLITTILLLVLFMGTYSMVEAVPPLPSSFHGTVKVNGAYVPAGTVISAWIDDVQYAQTTTELYLGESVYAIDVPGDDSSTAGIIEGGTSGDTIVFKIDGVPASQTGSWTSGTYVARNLSVQVITVTADPKTKTYGDADPTLTYTYLPSTPPVSFSGDLGRVAGEDVGDYEITIGTLSATGYTIVFTSADLTITAKPITITAYARSKSYGQVDPVLTYQAAPPLIAGDNFTGGLGRVSGENVGNYAILQGTLAIIDGNGGANYSITYVSANLTINKRLITVTADNKEKIVGNPDPVFTYTITTGSLAFEDEFSGALTRDAGEAIGAYIIRQGTLAIDDGNSGLNYDFTFINGTLTISQLPLTITANSASKVYGAADPVFTYTASDPSVPLTGALSRESGEDVGIYAITIGTLSAGDQYAITFVSADFTITRKAASVTPDPASKVYGSADPSFTGTLTGFLAGDGVTAVYSRTAGETVAGSPYTISAVLSPAGVLGNYDITYNTAAFTITRKAASVTPDPASKVYGSADPSFTGTLTGFLAGDGVTAVYSRTAGETVAGSPYTISAVLSPAGVLGNYDITYNTAAFTITRKVASVTPDVASKVYGAVDPALTGTLTGFVAGDGVTAVYSRTAGETVAGSPYTISAVLSPAGVLGNYEITYNTANFTITPKQITVTADAKSKTYGLPDPALTYVVNGLEPGDQVSGYLARVPGENVGTYDITIGTITAGSNYTITFVPNLLTISRRDITIAADNKTKLVGAPDPALTYSITSGSLAYSDSITGALVRDPGEAIGTYAIHKGSLAISDGNGGANYELTFVEGSLTIQPIPLIITANPASKVYGEADPLFTYTASDPTVPLNGALSRESGENVGIYAITIGTLSAGDQYAITFVSANFTITPRPITITADDKEKIEGEPDPMLTLQVTSGSLAVGDTITGALEREPGEIPGNYDILIGTVQIDDGNSGDNYDLTFVAGTFTIVQGTMYIYLPLILR